MRVTTLKILWNITKVATKGPANSEALKEFASKCDVAIHATAE
ncbi:MAG: hypothetical protein Ct9H300mP11_23910 [Chloroflexota bacterium]|nr:MAG: hypothetical protein Ct9H300mP11_23910 [Chloroflexota bacterium]